MIDRMQPFHITPRVIDFGSRVVALAHVTSVDSCRTRPYMLLGVALLVAGGALVGLEIVSQGSIKGLISGGSTRLWGAFIAAGLGIFAQVYQRRGLEITLSDRSKIRIDANRDDFLQSVVTRIGEAMRAGPEADLHYIVDAQQQTIQILTASTGSSPLRVQVEQAMPTVTAIPGGTAEPPFSINPPSAAPPAWTQHSRGPLPHEVNGRSHLRNGYPSGRIAGTPDAIHPITQQPLHLEPATEFRPNPNSDSPPTYRYNGGGAPEGVAHAHNGHAAQVGRAPAAAPSGSAIGPRDLDKLIEFVRQAELQHKDALLNLLNVVDDYAKGGTTHQIDAIEHWQSFSSYVHTYLADVDGLAALTDSAGRRFEQR